MSVRVTAVEMGWIGYGGSELRTHREPAESRWILDETRQVDLALPESW